MREYVLSPLRQEQQAWQRRVWCYTKNFSPVKLITTFIAFNWFLPVVKCLCVIICDYTTSYFCNKYNQAWQPCIYSHNKHTLWYNAYCKEKVSPLCVFSDVLVDVIFYYNTNQIYCIWWNLFIVWGALCRLIYVQKSSGLCDCYNKLPNLVYDFPNRDYYVCARLSYL